MVVGMYCLDDAGPQLEKGTPVMPLVSVATFD